MTPHLTHLEHRTEPLLRRLVGSILREQRERQRRTLRDVAEDARVSVAYLSEVERGRKEASSEVLAAVCRALGLRLVDLVGTAHAQLALAEGRLVVDLTAPAPADPATSGRHELASVTTLTTQAETPSPTGEVGTALLLAA
ncbi:helix-turn-helix domain-containing protein [Cellulomonas humilata]|uniref:Transcriptional regulator with XRE-family HTH domain n=1 Tax=Cellulomonas humilata TaxID=144055 RepID=A0ABU0EGA8_9CELL|nr:helix-turn-helix transcriptional regulator [Cellulomonas humilata]MDQ0374091.1 transcriptional regulator with XRE-family HTH domain [Cellulomonas humilata]